MTFVTLIGVMTMASDLISREALIESLWDLQAYKDSFAYRIVLNNIVSAPAVDAIPIDTVAEMLAELFGEECCCNYNGIDEWLPYLCEYSETCPDTIGKNGCWKQLIKHWKERTENNE